MSVLLRSADLPQKFYALSLCGCLEQKHKHVITAQSTKVMQIKIEMSSEYAKSGNRSSNGDF